MKKFAKVIISLTAVCVVVLAIPALAAECPDGRVCLENPVKGQALVPLILGNALGNAMKILGSAALLVFVYGGFRWIMAGGNAEQVKKGTQAMMWAVIGIVVIFSAYAIINLVVKELTAGSSGSSGVVPPATQTTVTDDGETKEPTPEPELKGTCEALTTAEGNTACDTSPYSIIPQECDSAGTNSSFNQYYCKWENETITDCDVGGSLYSSWEAEDVCTGKCVYAGGSECSTMPLATCKTHNFCKFVPE